MRKILCFSLFLFWDIYANSQNKKVNLNEEEKIEAESIANRKDRNDFSIKQILILSKTLLNDLNIRITELVLYATKQNTQTQENLL